MNERGSLTNVPCLPGQRMDWGHVNQALITSASHTYIQDTRETMGSQFSHCFFLARQLPA